MLSDIRFALRSFAKQPSFAFAAVATLALGIAVNTLVFSLVNSLALRPMPVPFASRVLRLYPVTESGKRDNLFSIPDYEDSQRYARVFETLAAYIPADLTAGRSSLDRSVAEPRAILGYVVSANYFDLTGVRASAGRLLHDADDRANARVAVIAYGLWRTRFGSDPRAVGASLVLNGQAFTIVGIATPDFHGTEPLVTDVCVPLTALPIADPGASTSDRDTGQVLLAGRLRADASRGGAAEALAVVMRRLAAAYPGRSRPARVEIAPATFFTIDPGLRPVIAIVMSIVGLVLLVACANVANLALARATSRQREIAVRLAIGAGRARIVRQLTIESLLIGLTAGAIGLLLAEWGLRVLYRAGVQLAPFAWTIALDLSPDVRVFAYTAGLAIAGGVLLGLLPALQSSSANIVAALRDEVGDARMRGTTLRQALVIVEIAASLVLLMGAGLLLRGLQRAHALTLGFSTAGVVYADQDLRAAGLPAVRAGGFNDALAARARQIPGVVSVAFTSHVPLHGGVHRAHVTIIAAGGAPEMTIVSAVSPEYFATLQIPLVAGRTFTPSERGAAMIGEGLARRFWPGESALGHAIHVEGLSTTWTIVGVVRDAANAAIWREKEMAVYLPAEAAVDSRDLHLIVRTSSDAGALARTLVLDAAVLDPDLRFAAVTLDSLLRMWMLPSRVAAVAATTLAILALGLACIGVYGVLSFTVAQRMREIGIRMALGADARGIIALVLRDGARLLAIGVMTGGACALPAAPLLGRLLFDVSAFDPATMITVPLVLAVSALGACYVPARRASRLQPLTVLRAD